MGIGWQLVVTEYRQHTTALALHMVSFLAGLETN